MTAPRTPVEPLAGYIKQLSEWLADDHLGVVLMGNKARIDVSVEVRAMLAALATLLAVQATDERELFEASLKAMPEWVPEFEVHRPWVEAFAWFVWRDARAQLAQAPAALTEEQIDNMLQDDVPNRKEMHDFARAIERAHGIGISHKEKDE